MDSITHTLFGICQYGVIKKEKLSKRERRAFLTASLVANQIPEIDVVSRLWDTAGQYQMWHRGITHSILMAPLWALLIYFLIALIFKIKDKKIFWLSLIGVFIHDTSDLFNAWGTGYLEPFSQVRITFGTIPIIDFVIWFIIFVTFVLSKRNKLNAPRYYQYAWIAILLHIFLQSAQGYTLFHSYQQSHDEVALSATFLPWKYDVITKNGEDVVIYGDSLLSDPIIKYKLHSYEQAELDDLFKHNPKAKTLYEWSPFVVIVNDDNVLGVYDPRFYRNGQSFLFEYMEKNQME
ncbi:metal-dependent hydrolase [Peribacillus acanthi]|uniref:metal-dependent hydrolase n=1 Tax=Peribacillus acanthi TaxID=2171554 RepID=UPI000D3E8C62|nr:metal-dependent hydrolase [Peribacillus acanthi]